MGSELFGAPLQPSADVTCGTVETANEGFSPEPEVEAERVHMMSETSDGFLSPEPRTFEIGYRGIIYSRMMLGASSITE